MENVLKDKLPKAMIDWLISEYLLLDNFYKLKSKKEEVEYLGEEITSDFNIWEYVVQLKLEHNIDVEKHNIELAFINNDPPYVIFFMVISFDDEYYKILYKDFGKERYELISIKEVIPIESIDYIEK